MRLRSWIIGVVVVLAVGCGGGGGGPGPEPTPTPTDTTTPSYTVGGTVAGLGNAAGLVVSAAGQNATVPAGATSYTFPGKIADGSYAVSLTAPAGMHCVVANDGRLVVSGADVTNVNITCQALTYTLGGAVTGMPSGQIVLSDGAGHQVTKTSEGPFTFSTPLAAGTAYNVTVVTPPSGRTCTVANASGTVGTANVTNVAVSCGAATFTVGGAVAGLAASGLQISNATLGTATVPANATTYQFPNRVPAGAYPVTVSSPAGVTCTLSTGSTIAVATANVTNANITCVGNVLQRWAAPTTWGGSAATFWDDNDPTMVQHAWFTSSGIQESKGLSWSLTGGASPTFDRLDAFPAGPRYGAGPFPVEGANYRQASADARLDLPGDMLVCAVVQPDTDPLANGWEKPIFSKGFGNYTNYLLGAGWSLMQMHESFCFHYETLDAKGASRNAMAFVTTNFADGNVYTGSNNGPRTTYPPPAPRSPLPNWAVVCAGRDGEDLVIAVNSADKLQRMSLAAFGPAPHTLDAASSQEARIGGYYGPLGIANSMHVFNGRVFETAVWSKAATAQNIQEKMAALQGLAPGVSYTRNRPGPFQFSGIGSGAYETAYRDGPRIDPAKGILIGLQSWNRVNPYMGGNPAYPYATTYPASEDLTLWTPVGNASVNTADTVATPARVGNKAALVTLPAGTALSIQLDQKLPNPSGTDNVTGTHSGTWDSRGFVHGQVWLRVPSAQPAGSKLTVHKTDPNRDTPTADHYDVDLAGLTPGTWTRVWLNGAAGALSTNGTVPGVLTLENNGSDPISFYAWGITVTQIGGGGDLNSISGVPVPGSQPSPDPGPFMYDWQSPLASDESYTTWFVEDVLQPPPLSGSTASSGFCLSVDARPADGFAWDARTHDGRTAIAWANSPNPDQVTRVLRLFVEGIDAPTASNAGKVCFADRALATAGDWATAQPEVLVTATCGAIPAGWTAGSAHNLKACVTPAGQVSIYADYDTNPTAIATGTLQNVPDLGTGRLLVGNGANKISSSSTPWHGYISAAAACRASNIAACR